MAHYAFIKDNLVTEVIPGKDETETAPDGFANWEEYYLTKRPDQDACKRTSYNTNANEHLDGGTAFRGNYAGVGYIYDASNDVFYSPQPFPSWTLDTNTWSWKAPLQQTEEELGYYWDENLYQSDNTKGWVEEDPS